jgi:endoglucanase
VYSNAPNQKDKAYEILNTINQEFTNLVRSSGGKNSRRYLLIAGYTTDIGLTVDPAFKMPRDLAAHSMVSVHYYTPATFALLEKDASWGKAVYTWGTPAEVQAVKTDMLPLKARFIDKGIPVILGEFGVAANKDPVSVVKYVSTVGETAYSMGVVPMLWDAGSFYNRRTLKWNNPKVGEALARIIPNYARMEAAQKARGKAQSPKVSGRTLKK